MSNSEEMLTAIIDGDIIVDEPSCRKEQFLKAIANGEGTTNLPEPSCREEKLLFQIAEKGLGGSETPDQPDMLQEIINQSKSCASLLSGKAIVDGRFLANLDTSEVTTMTRMFYNCSSMQLVDVSNFKTDKVQSADYMFDGCSLLESLDVSNFKTGNMTTLRNMFNGCSALESLDVSNFEIIPNANTSSMFSGCKKLKTLIANVLKTGSSAGYMFYNNNVLQSIPELETSNASNFSWMFNNCNSLETIKTIDLINATNVSAMFDFCKSLKNLTLKNIKISLILGNSTNFGHLLTNESLINTIKELWDLTGQTSQKLTMSAVVKGNLNNIYVKLVDVTDEMLAQDQYAGNKKPCVVCESTDEGAMTLTEYATSKNWAIA